MKIRLIRDEDYVACVRLHRQTIRNVNSKDYPEDVIRAWSSLNEKRMRTGASNVKRWVAIENNKIIGFVDHHILRCEILGLYVHKDYMGRGVGSRLLKTAEASLKKRGCKKIEIESSVTAKPFYQKSEYKVIKKSMHEFMGTKAPVFIMIKNI